MSKLAEKFNHWFQGNEHACSFAMSLLRVLHFWDDLIDKDKPVPPETINYTMWELLVVIPNNQFYQRNFLALNPIIQSGILNWHTANSIEINGSDEDKRTSYFIRAIITDYIAMTALIIGGVNWARQVHLEMHTLLSENSESFEEYLDALKKENREVLI